MSEDKTSPAPILVYSRYEADLPRFERLLSAALPDIEICYAGSLAAAEPCLKRAEVLYGWGFPAALLGRMPKLRWVQKMGAGVDDILDDWPCGADVVLTRTDGRLIARRMVEYVLGAILDKTSKFDLARDLQTKRHWDYFQIASIQDFTVGVAGLGEIGSEIARALGVLGADVVGWRRSSASCPFVRMVFNGAAALCDFVRACDVVVLALPLTAETRSLFGSEVLSHCRPGMHLINVGRGALVDENALLRALDLGQVAQATLDVFVTEPLPEHHPFWTHPRVTVTPHVCGPLIPEMVVPHFLSNYAAFASGKQMQHVVDLCRQY